MKEKIKYKEIIAVVVLALLVLAVSLICMTRSDKYDLAMKKYVDEKYSDAEEMFEKLGKYRKSEVYLDKCRLEIAKDALKNDDEYEKALQYLDKISNAFKEKEKYSDQIKLLYQDAKYQYVADHLDPDDEIAVAYADELYKDDYYGIGLFMNTLHPWTVNVYAVNIDPDDTHTNLDKVDAAAPFYLHCKAEGGFGDDKLTLYYEYTYADGSKGSSFLQEQASSGDEFWVSFSVNNAKNCIGNLHVDFFDAYGNVPVGSKDIEIAEKAEVGAPSAIEIPEEKGCFNKMLSYLGYPVSSIIAEFGDDYSVGDDGIDAPQPYFEYQDQPYRFYVADPSGCQVDSIEDTYYISEISLVKTGIELKNGIRLGSSAEQVASEFGELDLSEYYDFEDYYSDEMTQVGYYAWMDSLDYSMNFVFDMDKNLTRVDVFTSVD